MQDHLLNLLEGKEAKKATHQYREVFSQAKAEEPPPKKAKGEREKAQKTIWAAI